MFKFRRNKKKVKETDDSDDFPWDDDEPMVGKGFSSGKSTDGSQRQPLHQQNKPQQQPPPQPQQQQEQQQEPKKRGLFNVKRARSLPRNGAQDPQHRYNRSFNDDNSTADGTTDQEHSIPSLQSNKSPQPNTNQQRRNTTTNKGIPEQQNEESSEDHTPPIRNGESDEQSETSSYPSVGVNVVQGQRGRGAPPPAKRSNSRGSSDNVTRAASTDESRSSRGRDGRRRRTSSAGGESDPPGHARQNSGGGRGHSQPQQRQQQHNNGSRDVKSRMSKNKSSANVTNAPAPNKHRRNNSASNATVATHFTSATIKTTQSDKTGATNKSSTENAAMQQLAMLVVSLRSDLADTKKEKEEVEEQLKEAKKKQRPPPPPNTASSAQAEENPLLEEFRKENQELHADIDAFLLENEALTKDIAELREEKEAAEDLIDRLKADHAASSTSMDRKASVGSVSIDKNAALFVKLKELKEENHKLEGELRLMVDEKQDMMREYSNSMSAVALKEKEVEQLNAAVKDLAEQLVDAQTAAKSSSNDDEVERLKTALHDVERRLERQLEEKNEDQDKLVQMLRDDIANITIVKEELKYELEESNNYIAQLESDLDEKKSTSKLDLERYVTEVGEYESKMQNLRNDLTESEENRSELKSELKALREVLTNIEHQKREYQRKSTDSDVTNADLTRKIDDLVLQRSQIQQELESLREENRSMTEELEKARSEVVGPVSGCSTETVLSLQKMIGHLETSKEKLEANLGERDAQIKSDAEKIERLEHTLKVQDKMALTEGESDTELERRLTGVVSENEDMKPKILVLEDQVKALEEEVAGIKSQVRKKDEMIATIEYRARQLQSEIDTKAEKIWYQEEEINSLRKIKERIESDLLEASDAINLLEDELEQKESDVNSANVQVTVLRQKVSTLEKEKREMSDSNEKLEQQIDDLNTQIKVVHLEKHVSNEELESLKEAKLQAEDELHQLVRTSGEQISKLEEELDESSDAIALLKEELGIVEHHVADKDATIQELKIRLEDNQASQKELTQLKAEHQVSIDTISTLQKMIQTNEISKMELESELKRTLTKVEELKEQLSDYDALVEQVSDLTHTNEEIKKQMQEMITDTSTDLVSRPASVGTRKSVSRERAIAIIDGPDHDEDIITEAPEDQDDDMTHHTSAMERKPCENEDETSVPLTIEPKSSKICSNLSASQSSREGSSLLEQAKTMVQELEVKRSKTPDKGASNVEARDKSKQVSRKKSKDESVKAFLSSTKGKELVTDSKQKPGSEKKFDIDQLTAIYFEKCGMSASKLSDMSSDASSSVYRRANQKKENAKTKKVKICRNGVFMGTYEGDLNAKGQRHGFGVLICDNGNSYEGDWKLDKRDGLGIARYSSGDVYDGEWKRGKRQGHGVMYIESGDTYIGSWDKGLKHGAGTYHWADGEVDVSWYEEDRRVGEGVRWNATRNKAFQLNRGSRQNEIPLDEAYKTAEKLGLNLASNSTT
eukprot:scaffold298885_cov89-Cyclotella_meneghiniana.AAC.1